MNEEARAALLNSQTACALIEAQGMTAENNQREHRGKSPAYGESDFSRLIEKYGIDFSAAISMIRGE